MNYGDTSFYTDPDFISKIAQLQDDPAALRALAMSPVDPTTAANAAKANADMYAAHQGYYSGTGTPGMQPANPSVGQLLSGAATGVAGYRPPAPTVVNPGHSPVAGAAQHSNPTGAPMPQRQPYHIGKLLSGR